jgi:hypothetical protein
MSGIVAKDQWSQNSEQPPGPCEEFTFGCFMRPQRGEVAGSPRTPCSNVTLTNLETKVRCHDFCGPPVRSTASTFPGNGFSLVIVFLESRIVFVVLIIGPFKRNLEVHVRRALMTNNDLQSPLIVFGPWSRPSSETAIRRHLDPFVHLKGTR